ncbi:hypothetical protein D3C76_949590 [compost metagenome]
MPTAASEPPEAVASWSTASQISFSAKPTSRRTRARSTKSMYWPEAALASMASACFSSRARAASSLAEASPTCRWVIGASPCLVYQEYWMPRRGRPSRKASSAALPRPRAGKVRMIASTGMHAVRKSGSSARWVDSYSPRIARLTEMTRESGTKTFFAATLELPLPEMPITFQSLRICSSAVGIIAAPWSITRPSASTIGMPSRSQLAW